MDEEAVKILEIGGEAWMGGISLQASFPVAGTFRQASNYDPFRVMGVFSPSPKATQRGASSVTTPGAFNVGFEVGGVSYFYSFANGTKVYRVNTLTPFGDVDDVSASISDIATIRGATKHKGKIVYASDTSLKYNNTDTSTPGDGFTLANQRGIMSLTTGGVHVLQTGPDRNLYVTNRNKIGRVSNMAAAVAGVPAAGNSNSYLTFEDDVEVRDLSTDGTYLVMLGDTNNNFASGGNTKVRCFVAFWNMKSQDLTRIWEFEDTVVYGLEFTGEEFIVHCRDNVYTCSIDSPIDPLIPRRGNTNLTPATIYQGGIGRSNGSCVWGEGGNVYAYGRPHKALKKILYNPYSLDSGNVFSIFVDSRGIFVMSDDGKLYDFITGDQVSTAVLMLADIDFKKTYRFAYVKVILRDALATGDSMSVQILTQGGSKIVLNDNDMSYSTDGPVSSKILYPEAGGSSDALLFEDLTNMRINSNNGANIRRVEVWAFPADQNQNLGY